MPELPSPARHLAPSTPPTWLVELLAILDERRVMVMRTALGILLGGLLLSAIAPGVLAPSILVGLLVALAAVAISAGVAFALDSADPVVKGPRHVIASGGELFIQGRATVDTAKAVAQRLTLEVATSEAGTYGFIELGEGHSLTQAAVAAVAESLAGEGHRVIQADLTAPSDGDGIAEVAAGTSPLSRAVHFSSTGMTLARIDAGRSLMDAQQNLPAFVSGLPGDIDAVLVSLPPVGAGAPVNPEGLQRVFIIVVQGVSRRLDLLATMEKYDAGGRAVHVLLVDPHARAAGLPVPPLATEAVADPMLADLSTELDLTVDPAEAEAVALDLATADPATITAPVPRVGAGEFNDDPSAQLADADDAPRPRPLSPALAARLQRQQQRGTDVVGSETTVGGGWQVRPPGETAAAAAVAATAAVPAPAAPLAPAAPAEPEAPAPPTAAVPAPAAPIPAPMPDAPKRMRDDLDPELLAAALAMGDLDDLDDEDEGNAPSANAPTRSAAASPATPLPATAPAQPAPTAAPLAASPEAPPAAPSSITGGLSRQFNQRPAGSDATPDDSPRNGVANSHPDRPATDRPTSEAAPAEPLRHDETMPIGRVLLHDAPVIALEDDGDFSAPEHTMHDVALGAADDGDDDPLGMTAALHQFTLERIEGRAPEDDDQG